MRTDSTHNHVQGYCMYSTVVPQQQNDDHNQKKKQPKLTTLSQYRRITL